MWMKNVTVAKIVSDALRYGETERGLYRVFAFVVMSNHVHLLIETIEPLQEITRLLKGYTARCANLVLSRTGQPFWQDESFDHWVRTPAEGEEIRRYIQENPVKAGLVDKPAAWRW